MPWCALLPLLVWFGSDGADCKAVVVEAEDLSYSGDWEVVKDSDASGGEYLVWNGLEAEENNRDAADGDIITTMIDIKTAGTYRFRWRMRQPPNVASDRGNDSWLYFPDGPFPRAPDRPDHRVRGVSRRGGRRRRVFIVIDEEQSIGRSGGCPRQDLSLWNHSKGGRNFVAIP